MRKMLICFWVSSVCLIQVSFAQDCDLETLVRKYAPQLRLHSDDKYKPASVEWFLPKVTLRYDKQIIKDVGELSHTNFHEQKHGNILVTQKHTPFDTNIPLGGFFPSWTEYGNAEETKIYAHVGHSRFNPEDRYITYWIFYPYNGPSLLGQGAHDGDWERITVRLNGQCGSISKIHYGTHGDQGKWYLPGEFKVTHGTHPIVYSAKNGHGCYPTSGKQARGAGTPDDHTNNSGIRIDGWENFQIIRVDDEIAADAQWVNYMGLWGGQDGVTGPNHSRTWRDFDENITFFEKNGGFGDRILAIADYKDHNLDLQEPLVDYWTGGLIDGGTGPLFNPLAYFATTLAGWVPAQWTNDRIRSARIFSARAGTVIKVYDSPSASASDDFATIRINRNINSFFGVVIPSFEKSYSNENFTITYFRDNGLDGKISHIKVYKASTGDPTLIVGSGAACYNSKSTYKLLFGNRQPRDNPNSSSWTVSPASWFKNSAGNGFSTTLEVIKPAAQGEATITFTQGSKTYTRKIWIGKPKRPGIIAGPATVAANSSVTYSVPNVVSPNDGYYHWGAPCTYDLFTQTKTCWDDLGGTGTVNSFLSNNLSGTVQLRRVNECGESSASTKSVTISGSNDSPNLPRFGPNPADETLTIRSNTANLILPAMESAASDAYDIKLYNSDSKLIYSGQMSKDDPTEINTGQLKEGIYYLVMSNDHDVIRKQIIVNHE